VKPVSGTFDLISNTSEGVKNSAKSKDGFVEWCWLPRPFYNRENIFKVYNINDAYVIGVLNKLEVLKEGHVFKASYVVQNDPIHLLAIFEQGLYKIKVKQDKPGSVKRAFNWVSIELVEKTNSSVVIHIKQRDPATGN